VAEESGVCLSLSLVFVGRAGSGSWFLLLAAAQYPVDFWFGEGWVGWLLQKCQDERPRPKTQDQDQEPDQDDQDRGQDQVNHHHHHLENKPSPSCLLANHLTDVCSRTLSGELLLYSYRCPPAAHLVVRCALPFHLLQA